MSLPIDRTTLTAATTNQVPNAVIQSAKNIAAITTAFNGVDEVYNYATGLVSASTLSRLGIINVKDYGASGLATTATGSITSGTKVLTLTATPDFVAGHGINLQGAFEVASLLMTVGASSSANCTVTLNGVAKTVALTSGWTATQVATAIRATTFPLWTTGGSGTTVTFTSNYTGTKTDASYTVGTTGSTATMTTTTQGTADQISTVASVLGLIVTIADNATRTIVAGTISHDDTAAVLAAVAALSTYGTLNIPNGIYLVRVNQWVITKSNIRITGGGVLKAVSGTAGYFLRVQATSNVEIDTVRFDTPYSLFNETEPAVTAITIETPSDGTVISGHKVKNCRITNWTTYGVAITENSDDNNIKNAINNIEITGNYITACTICIETFAKVLSSNILVQDNYEEVIGTYADSTCMKPAQGYQKAVIDNNICIGGLTSGLSIGIAGKYQTYSNNVILTTGTAVGINNTDHALFTPGYLENITFSNNLTISSSGVALLINGKYDFVNMKISDSTFVGSTYSLFMQPVNTATGNLSNVFFSNNIWNGKMKTFRSDDNSKVLKKLEFKGNKMDSQFDCQYVEDIEFTDTTVNHSTTFGAQFTGCSDLSITNLRVKNPATEGLVISGGSRATVDSCKFINCNTSNTASTNCLNVVGTPNIVTIKNCTMINETSVGYATRAVVVDTGTNVTVGLDNTYIGMVDATVVLFSVRVAAHMIMDKTVYYGTNTPSTEYPASTSIVGDRWIKLLPVEAGSAASKYVIYGGVCSNATGAGTWLDDRRLTGN